MTKLSKVELRQQVKEISDTFDQAIAGRNSEAVLIAITNLCAASLCYASNTRANAYSNLMVLFGDIEINIKRMYVPVQKVKSDHKVH